jgi:lipopolysaccharide transport system ATP-binding protein
MSAVLRFDDVSKVYRLGEARRSFREAFSRASRFVLSPRSRREEHLLWALKGVTFEVEPGEAFGIIGPNGAGKTTILKLLSKITQPTSGRITVDGRVSALIELGAGFHPDLTGRENIYLNAVILGLQVKEVKRLFDQIVDFSGLERFIDTPVKRYSSGMYVRLGFSVAAHVNPDVLLVDEVLAVGDSQFRQRCAQRIEDLKDVGTTIVFVSHNVHLVRSICSRGVFLANGQSQTQGDMVDVINAYQTYLHEGQLDESVRKVPESYDPSKSSVVEITKVEIRSLNGELADRLCYTDAAEVRVHFFAREPVPKPNLVVRIVRSDGTTCCMIRTADYGHELDDLDGQGVVSLAIDPLQLAEGVYVLDARIVGALDGAPLAIHHSRWFQVAGPSVGHGESGGVFAPHVARVHVEQEGQSFPPADNAVGNAQSP